MTLEKTYNKCVRGLGTRNALLRYGICVPCSKRLPGVRDAFSGAFGVKNRLLRYGRDIRCQKQPSVVRDASSKSRRTADSTDCGQPPVVRDAFSEAYRAKSSTCRTGRILSARNAHRSEVIRLKRGCIPWKSLRIHPPILILKIVSHRCHHAHFLDIRSVAVAIFYRENSLARSLDFAEAATGVTREFLSYFTSVSCSFLHH